MYDPIRVKFTCKGCGGQTVVASCKNLTHPIQCPWLKAYPGLLSRVVMMQPGLKVRRKKT